MSSNLQKNANNTQTATSGATGNPGGVGGGGGGGGGSGGGDMLDKGVDFLGRKAGHEQSRSTTEKISDGVRKGFQKVTGKDVPIADKDYSQGK